MAANENWNDHISLAVQREMPETGQRAVMGWSMFDFVRFFQVKHKRERR